MSTTSEIAEALLEDAAALEREIAEIDMLVAQARTEAGHHQTRRSVASDKLTKLAETASVQDVMDLATQVVTLTRRSALMDAQLEILEAKRRSITRLQETIRVSAEKVNTASEQVGAASSNGSDSTNGTGGAPIEAQDPAPSPQALSKLVLSAQEDLRREIARNMHDGPAQSLTNIVLQAEIVERLVSRDPSAAAGELRQLVAMVQQTLEATKTFIFDVRPMVLDDLGLVPTLRRSARDRGQRAGVTVEFESIGVDQRLDVDTESALFRIADEALGGFLARKPERMSVGIDWGDSLVITIRAERTPEAVPALDLPPDGENMPPALVRMMGERRAKHAVEVGAAEDAATVNLPATLARDLEQRAATLGINLDIGHHGGFVRLMVPVSTRIEAAAPV
ncbi:MAG: histidine kinase [Chloroflexota bacterium]